MARWYERTIEGRRRILRDESEMWTELRRRAAEADRRYASNDAGPWVNVRMVRPHRSHVLQLDCH